MIDFKTTICIVNDYTGPLKESMITWVLKHFPQEQIVRATVPKAERNGDGDCPYLCGRNLAIRDCAIGSGDWTDALFIDNDVTPTASTWQFLEGDGDVVACRCSMKGHPHAWDHPEDFHNALWRCKTKVLRAIEPPWFNFIYSDDGCSVLGCDCLYFAKKVRAAGFTIAHRGRASHDCSRTWS